MGSGAPQGNGTDKLCDLEDLTPGRAREFRCVQGFIFLLRHDNGVAGWLNSCPHQGRSLNFAPDEFLMTPAGHLVCPHHGAVFDVASGLCLEGPCKGAGLTPVSIQVEQGEVRLRTSG